MNEEIGQSAPGSNGVIMLPDLVGSGCLKWDSQARGIFFNLGFETTRPDMLRAGLEGIGAEVQACVGSLVSMLPTIKQLQSTGGLARFTLFNQIIADMTGKPVAICNQTETTAQGAWIVAASAMGLFISTGEAFNKLQMTVQPPEIVYPNDFNQAIYRIHQVARNYVRNSLDNNKLSQLLY